MMVWMLGGYMWLFIHRPFEVWPWLGDFQIERIYMLLMIAFWAVQPNKGWLPNRLHAAIVVFTLVLTLAWVASPFMYSPGCPDAVENYFKVAVFYILVVTSVRDEKSLKTLLFLFLVAVCLYDCHSMREYLCGRCQRRMGTNRMIGVDSSYMDPNAFASGLVCALPLTLPFWAEKPSWWTRVFLLGFSGLACVSILLTGSRTGFMALSLCVFLCLFATGRAKTALLSLVLVSVAAPVAWFALPQELRYRYLTIIDPSFGPKNAEVSAEGRIDGLVYGYEAWTRSPLIGHGPGAFKYATNRELQAHNLYGQVISEMGALGALALVGLIACFVLNWREAARLRRLNPDEPPTFANHVVRAMALEVVLLLFLGWSGHNLYRFHWIWFAAFQAVALHCIRKRAAALNEEWLFASEPVEETWEAAEPVAVGSL
jgi:O-antigen ligase